MESYKAVTITKPGELNIETRSIDLNAPLKKNQVLVKIKSVGICGTDLLFLEKGKIGKYEMKKPTVVGHEAAGIVVSIGKNVKNVAVGDKVALEPGIPCRMCEYCRKGAYNLCPEIKYFAFPPVDGVLQSYLIHDADFCHKLPPNLSTEEGAICQPLSIAVYACERGNIRPGMKVIIMGSGPIGIMCYLVCKAFGAHEVIMTDIDQSKIDFAKKLGVKHAIHTPSIEEGSCVPKEVEKCFGSLADVSIDCCGFNSATVQAIKSTKNRGVCVFVGIHDEEMKLPVLDCFSREIDLRGIFRVKNSYPICISMIEKGIIDVSPLITQRYNPFNRKELDEGFGILRKRDVLAVKVMFNLP